ncbi:hypothetical protein ACFL1O_00030 [Patescibacteria group bacterium]
MAEEKIPTSNPGRDLRLFILFLIIFGIIWFVTQFDAESPPKGPLFKEMTPEEIKMTK